MSERPALLTTVGRWDFVHDRLVDSRRFRSPAIVDQASKQSLGSKSVNRSVESASSQCRDPLFAAAFTATLKDSGTESVKLPPKRPNLNAYVERFARSIKDECRSRLIPPAERHLRSVVSDFFDHYH